MYFFHGQSLISPPLGFSQNPCKLLSRRYAILEANWKDARRVKRTEKTLRKTRKAFDANQKIYAIVERGGKEERS